MLDKQQLNMKNWANTAAKWIKADNVFIKEK